MAEGVTVRTITVDDFAAVTRLLAELGRPALAPETEAAVRAVYLRHVARDDTASLLAEAGGDAIGFMSLEFRERLNRPTLEAWIPDLIVTEAARGTGAGKALLQRGIELARERGCHNLTLESGYARTVAHQFYQMQGMTQNGLYFALKL
jgi:GNAT superfamily N-acetyltransferase